MTSFVQYSPEFKTQYALPMAAIAHANSPFTVKEGRI